MPFSFARRLELGQSKNELYVKVVRRTLILFLLGMVVQGNLLDFKLSTLHPFSNTLQAIAVGYLVASFLMINLSIWGQMIAAVVLMVAYWLLMAWPVAGGIVRLEQNANVALTADKWVLGRYIDGTHPPYTWVLSGMTFTATVLLGVFGGHVLRSRNSPPTKVILLALLGVACLVCGWAWAEWLGFPIIKHIWTSSMVLWAAGWSYLLLAAFYLVIDILGWHRLAFPFVVVGMNAITIYVANYYIPFHKIAADLVGGLARHLGTAGPFAISLTAVFLMWLLLYHLYRQKIFLRI
jgi:predicted acyltransferase